MTQFFTTMTPTKTHNATRRVITDTGVNQCFPSSHISWKGIFKHFKYLFYYFFFAFAMHYSIYQPQWKTQSLHSETVKFVTVFILIWRFTFCTFSIDPDSKILFMHVGSDSFSQTQTLYLKKHECRRMSEWFNT